MALLGNLTGSSQFFSDDLFYNGVATQSARFDDGSSAFLHRTPSGAGNQKTWTFSAWIKPANQGINRQIFTRHDSGSNTFVFRLDQNDDLQVENYTSSAYQLHLVTDAKFRDSSAWYHVVLSLDTTQGTAANRAKLYVNGVQQTSFSSSTYPSQDADLKVNAAAVHRIGARAPDNYFDGYMAEVNFVDGTQYAASDFGETKNGVWIAKEPSVTYGTNGFRLQFTGFLGTDTSGNSNNFTPSGFSADDTNMPDSPENNFCTINSIRESTIVSGSVTLSEGNLQSVDGGTTYGRHWSGTFGMSTGKWYWEVLAHTLGGSHANIGLGNDVEKQSVSVSDGAIAVYYGNDGKRNPRAVNTGTTSYGATYADDDIIGIAFDADNESVTFYKNNSSQGAVGSVLVQSTGPYFASVGDGQNATTYKYVANFGQDSSFAGNKTAQGNTDGNGIGDFYYAPPSGYLALCTSNLPEPTIGPNSLTQADDHFNTVLYNGSNSTNNVTGVGFQPDWVWIKRRNDSGAFHAIHDSSRPTYAYLRTNDTNAENTTSGSDWFKSFDSDGFTVVHTSTSSGTTGQWNQSGGTFVAWNWKAGGGASSNSEGNLASNVNANTDAGFSIVTWTGNGNASVTLGHGLNSTPELIIYKGREVNYSWPVWFKTFGTSSGFFLNVTNAAASHGRVASVPNSTVIGNANLDYTNTNTEGSIAYCFHSVEGYSKIGSYTGNGNADGTFVALNFSPAWIMLKRTDSADDWIIVDTARAPINDAGQTLFANLSDAETDYSTQMDIVSNGFKLRNSGGSKNASSGSYIYMAFAEAPFKYANAR